ncbi:MAG: hypothetical protein JNL98_34155 [Bryobacterales bacterium]|nr:hypothetical protein [Bryobacterales bacterium]
MQVSVQKKAPVSGLQILVRRAIQELTGYNASGVNPQAFDQALKQRFEVVEAGGKREVRIRTSAVDVEARALEGSWRAFYRKTQFHVVQMEEIIAGIKPEEEDCHTGELRERLVLVEGRLRQFLADIQGPELPLLDRLESDLKFLSDRLEELKPVKAADRCDTSQGEAVKQLTEEFSELRADFNGFKASYLTDFPLQRRRMESRFQRILQSVEAVECSAETECGSFELYTPVTGELTVAGVLGWARQFAANEGPSILSAAGITGIVAVGTYLKTLRLVVQQAAGRVANVKVGQALKELAASMDLSAPPVGAGPTGGGPTGGGPTGGGPTGGGPTGGGPKGAAGTILPGTGGASTGGGPAGGAATGGSATATPPTGPGGTP